MYSRNPRGGSSRPFARTRPSNNHRRPAPRKRGHGDYIDVARFINRAAPVDASEPVVVSTASFTDFAFDDRIKRNIISRNYITPSPIQEKAIPHVMLGKDVVGIANTGTGKTAAFLLPLLHKVLGDKSQQILVVAPTRELAIQIDDELKKFSFGLGVFSAICVGGAPIGKQIRDLRHFNNFVIGTPGRLKDLIEQRVLNLAPFRTLVLDEADRMLDMGFINDIKYLVGLMSRERHTLFFSATLSSDIERLIHEFLKDPVRISVKTRDTSKAVDQDVVRITPDRHKLDVLHDMLRHVDFEKVLIFGRTKHGVERLSRMLDERGVKVASIHGDKAHSQRQRALDQFKRSDIQALVATDVAARGLDIPNVSHVINYDLPATYEDYIHRIGRTGRGGKTGKALTFVE